MARSGHHSGSNRNNNIRTTTSSETIASNSRKQVVVVVGEGRPVTKMGRNRMGLLLGPSRSGMVLAAAEQTTTTVTATTTMLQITTTTTRNRMQTPTQPTTKSVIGSALRTRTGSRRTRCAAGARSRKAFATTGGAGRSRWGCLSCSESAAIGGAMNQVGCYWVLFRLICIPQTPTFLYILIL